MIHPSFLLAAFLLAGWLVPQASLAQTAQPIIDIHGHAYRPGMVIGGPRERLLAPTDPDGFLDAVLAELDRHGVVLYLASGAMEDVIAWHAAAPDRIWMGVLFPCISGRIGGARCFEQGEDWPELDWLRREITAGRVKFMGEITAVYAGISPADPRLDPYFALASEFSIPVGIHTGAGPLRRAPDCCPEFDGAMGNPVLLEPVLRSYPDLRLFLMHAGGPSFLDETVSLMRDHPNVYADLSAIALAWPQGEFDRWVRAFLDAGLEDRLLFGSDAVFSLGPALEVLSRIPFLTVRQRKAILYDNAARFLGLGEPD